MRYSMPAMDFIDEAPPLRIPYSTGVGANARTTVAAKKVAVDVGTAGAAATVLAPIITVIDRAVVEATAGGGGMLACVKRGMAAAARTPHKFLMRREVRLVWGVYAATYATANLAESVSAPKLLTVTPVNMGMSIMKDRAFALMFGSKGPTTMALSSYALFAARDTLTIGASYSAPNAVAGFLKEKAGLSDFTAGALARMSLPAAAQAFCTPFHLAGLDLYNRSKASRAERVQLVKELYAPTVMARVLRIVPAFGVGSLLTTRLRDGANRALGVGSKGTTGRSGKSVPMSAGAVRWATVAAVSSPSRRK